MIVLAVSRSAQRGTSGMIEGLAACFTGLEDPRETRRCDHQLVDILVIAACAVIACAESWEDIELYGRSMQAWLKTFLALPNGIPSHDTFRRVFMLIDPDAFEACFSRWAQSLAVGSEREVVAVDGKTVRRSGGCRHDHGPLHLVSAWASGRGLALGQRAVDGESNEIAAIPELLDTLHLDGCIVTLDAMGCQKEIAERIRAKDPCNKVTSERCQACTLRGIDGSLTTTLLLATEGREGRRVMPRAEASTLASG
jgi:predicted transposase YbfD/YdcC